MLYENVDWIDLAQYRDYWRDFTDIAMEYWDSLNPVIFSTC
jgi:hypothetical protein